MKNKIIMCSILLLCISIYGFEDVNAKSKYALISGKLVDSKTKKVIQKTTLYKNKLYQKGGKLYKGKIIYKKIEYKNGLPLKDREKPKLTFNRKVNSIENVELGSKYKLPIAHAKDRVSGVRKVKVTIVGANNKVVKKIDTNKLLKYTIIFEAKDLQKNTVQKKITLNIVDDKNSFEITEIK